VASAVQKEKPAPAVVRTRGRPVVVFRGFVFGYPPEERAKAAQERIERLLAKPDIREVGTKETPEGTLILIGGEEAFLIAAGDLSAIYGETSEFVVGRAVRALNLAAAEIREGREPRIILKAALYAAVATILCIVFVWIVARGCRTIMVRLENVTKRHAKKLQISGFDFFEYVLFFTGWITRVAAWVIYLFAVYSWLTFALEQFPYTRIWGESLGFYLFSFSKTIGLGIIEYVPDLLCVVVIFLIANLISNLTGKFFLGVETGTVLVRWLHPDIARPTSRIAAAGVWIFALIVAYPYLPGSGTDAFKGVSVFLGVILSLGSTSIVNQATSGLVLMYAREFKPGDFVQVGQTEGVVLSLGVLTTKIKTLTQEEVSIPNAIVVSNTTINRTSLLENRNGATLSTSVTIGYSTPWRKVEALLLLAAERTAGLRKDRPPLVWQNSLSDFYVEYRLNVVIERPETRLITLSELNANIQDVFNEHGEQIMSPHYLGDPPQKVWVPKERWHEPPAKTSEEPPKK
jgi:small-conductance mechanosensitive channel